MFASDEFLADAILPILDFVIYEDAIGSFADTEDKYDVYEIELMYAGSPGKYFGYRSEEILYNDGKDYGYQRMDEGQVYQLSDDCKIYRVYQMPVEGDFPKSSYSYKYYLISEKQLRSVSSKGAWLFDCWVKDGEIVHLIAVSSP